MPLVKSEFYDTRASPCCVVLSEGIVFHQASILPSSFAKLVLPKSVELSVPDPEVSVIELLLALSRLVVFCFCLSFSSTSCRPAVAAAAAVVVLGPLMDRSGEQHGNRDRDN